MDERAIGPRLGSGKEAEVFELGALVLKLYRRPAAKPSAFREAATLALLEPLGLPVPRVGEVIATGGRWGLTMSRAAGMSFGAAIRADPALAPRCLEAMAAVHHRIHAAGGDRLPDLKAGLARNIDRAEPLGPARRRRLRDRLATLPDGRRLCHGDFHPDNVVGAPDAAIVIDWLDAACGSPLADVCRSYVLMARARPDLAEAYVGAYAAATGSSRDDIMAWLPVVAAARLAEGVPGAEAALLALVDAPD